MQYQQKQYQKQQQSKFNTWFRGYLMARNYFKMSVPFDLSKSIELYNLRFRETGFKF